uniref:Uncharacterized protein n=1 Tax=Leersia perrieri TaxID=77586 RepID=A0A0D9WI23_9ORYZ
MVKSPPLSVFQIEGTRQQASSRAVGWPPCGGGGGDSGSSLLPATASSVPSVRRACGLGRRWKGGKV